jgi:hypothetical protein
MTDRIACRRLGHLVGVNGFFTAQIAYVRQRGRGTRRPGRLVVGASVP